MKFLAGIFLFLFFVSASAQQGLQMDIPEMDSTSTAAERQLMYQQLISGNTAPLLTGFNTQLPDFNFWGEFQKRYTLNFDFYPLASAMDFVSPFHFNTLHMPFFHNGEILSEAAYKLGENFVLGGYSYGANSVFSAPLPNQGASYFDTYGSTLFMQYKVSKNFKIETRINVNRHQGPGF